MLELIVAIILVLLFITVSIAGIWLAWLYSFKDEVKRPFKSLMHLLISIGILMLAYYLMKTQYGLIYNAVYVNAQIVGRCASNKVRYTFLYKEKRYTNCGITASLEQDVDAMLGKIIKVRIIADDPHIGRIEWE